MIPESESKDDPDHSPNKERRKSGLRDPLGRRGPERLTIFDGLTSAEQESTDQTDDANGHPVESERDGRFDASHGASNTAKAIDLASDIYSFTFYNMGLKPNFDNLYKGKAETKKPF